MNTQYAFEKDPRPAMIGFEMIDEDLKALAAEMNAAEFDPAKFPYFNVYRGTTHYMVKMNVAGYKADELEVSIKDGIMTVKGDRKPYVPSMDAVFQGIAEPDSFVRQFRLADNLMIEKIGYGQGSLYITLKIMFVAEREGVYATAFEPGDKPKPFVVPKPVVSEPTPVVVEPAPVAPVVEPAPAPAQPEIVGPAVANT